MNSELGTRQTCADRHVHVWGPLGCKISIQQVFEQWSAFSGRTAFYIAPDMLVCINGEISDRRHTSPQRQIFERHSVLVVLKRTSTFLWFYSYIILPISESLCSLKPDKRRGVLNHVVTQQEKFLEEVTSAQALRCVKSGLCGTVCRMVESVSSSSTKSLHCVETYLCRITLRSQGLDLNLFIKYL